MKTFIYGSLFFLFTLLTLFLPQSSLADWSGNVRCGQFKLGFCTAVRVMPPGYTIDNSGVNPCPATSPSARTVYSCRYPIHTCGGLNSNNTTNGLCIYKYYDCQGMSVIAGSAQTCINAFNGDGSSDGGICCSVTNQNGPSGTPTPVAPTAQVQNPCPNFSCSTAFGPINVGSGQDFVTFIFRIVLSLSGGIALLLIIYSGFNMSLSQGNPEKINGAKETLTSAIIGLIFIILSVTILQIIGVNVLGIFTK